MTLLSQLLVKEEEKKRKACQEHNYSEGFSFEVVFFGGGGAVLHETEFPMSEMKWLRPAYVIWPQLKISKYINNGTQRP